MNLKEEILREHSKEQADRISRYIGNDPKRFAELMELFFESEYKVTQRAAWPMSTVALKYSKLFYPYFEKAVQYLKQPSIHNAVARNVLRVIQDLEIPEELQGELVDICLGFVSHPKQPGAIKAFSISVLKKICKTYPELAEEVGAILKERLPFEKPAFKVRAKDFLKDFPC